MLIACARFYKKLFRSGHAASTPPSVSRSDTTYLSATLMITAISLLLFFALLLLIASRCKAHERETGLSPPSAETLASIQREARERQVPALQAYSEWIAREQRAQSIADRSSN
jgi:hypothetical protein